MPADWNFFAISHDKGENDGAGGDVRNSVQRKVLQGKSVVGDLETFVTLAKSKYPEFIIERFKTAEICEATKHLAKQYEKHSKKLPNTIKYHRITIENAKVVGHLLTKTCLCYCQLGKDQEEQSNISQSDNTISPTVGQFYKVNYHFLDAKGGEIVQCVPAMCSKNDLQEHLFTILKQTRPNHYLLNDSDQVWINENDICMIQPFPNLTGRAEYQWEDEI